MMLSLTEDGIDKLTEDLIYEVLLRLPVKDLLQLKSVSKSWFSLISSHRFTKYHFDHTSAAVGDNDDETLIVQLKQGSSYSLFHVGFGLIVKGLKFPYSQGEYSSYVPKSARLLGSHCGIVCVSVDVSSWAAATKNKYDIYLWNPATKQSKLIPPYTVHDYEDDHIDFYSLALGFDLVDFDFKVIRVIGHLHYAQVYSSNKNAWRKVEPSPTDMLFADDCNLCLHGFLCGKGLKGMMAFDLNKEVFICNAGFPVDVAFKFSDARFTKFQDSIAITVISMFEENIKKGKIKLWTLDDEACLRGGGVKASWTMMLNSMPFQFFDGVFSSVEFLLRDQFGERFLYNSDTKVVRYVSNSQPREVFKYMASLFSVPGFKRVKWSDNREVEDDTAATSSSSEIYTSSETSESASHSGSGSNVGDDLGSDINH